MNNLRTASGREIRSAALHEHPLPIAYDPTLLPGARVLAEDGQIYESMKDWVSGAYEWKVRAQGEPGPALELQSSLTHLQWRVEGSTGAWTDLVALVDITGPQGEQGPQGPQGAGLSYQGSVPTVADLPEESTLGYAYLVEADNDLWIYNGTDWLNAGPIQGPQGEQGIQGEIGPIGPAGADGAAVQLQKTLTEIQWRLTGEPDWQTLVLLDELKGPVGDQGPTGPTGASFSFQGSLPTVSSLPSPSTVGHAYLVEADGNLYIYNGTAWVSAGPLQGPPGADGADGADGAQGPAGPIGPGFSYQGSVATVGALPLPSTQGHAYLVEADGNLYIYNGVAWVNAGPLQGPPGADGADGAPGDQGPAGPVGPGFSFQGTVATVGALPSPSTQGHAYLVEADGHLYIYNGLAWVDAGPLQGPPGNDGQDGAPGDIGPAGPTGPGFSFQGTVATVANLPNPSTQGYAYLVSADGHLYIYNGLAWVDAGPLQGPQGEQGIQGVQGDPGPAGPGLPAGGAQYQLIRKSVSGTDYVTEWFTPTPETVGLDTSSTPQFAGLGLGTAAVAGWELTVNGGTCQLRSSVSAVSGVYTLDVQAANEFVTAAAINGATTINLSNLNTIPTGYVWRGVLSFAYTSGVVSWFTGNSGYTVKWDGGIAPTLTASETESVVITVVGGGSTIEVAALQGRA